LGKIKFEDKIDAIDKELDRQKYKWRLKAIAYMDYEDVKQIIRIHIYKKWGLWDQSKAIEPWLNRVINNQLINILRNYYGNIARPCIRCAANEGGDLCSLYVTQNSQCRLYAKWEKGKKRAYNVKIPVALEHHSQEINNNQNDIRYEELSKIVHERVLKRLNATQKEVYSLLYIEGKDEKEVAKTMGYEGHKYRPSRFKQIENYKKIFIRIAKEIIFEEDLM